MLALLSHQCSGRKCLLSAHPERQVEPADPASLLLDIPLRAEPVEQSFHP